MTNRLTTLLADRFGTHSPVLVDGGMGGTVIWENPNYDGEAA